MTISITTTPQLSGNVYETEFTFTKVAPAYFTKYTWDLGDGTHVYDKPSVSHTYNYPGIYTVTLTAWSELGITSVTKTYVTVDYVLRDKIEFTQIPNLNGLPGLASNRPFIVSLTSCKIDQPLKIILQPHNTKSVPHYVVPTKWDFLVPRWRFLNADTKEILQDDSIEVFPQPIYVNGKVVAVSGQASFYYIDDLSTGIDPIEECPLMILATLSTLHFTYPPESLIYPYHSYSNNETVKTAAFWRIEDVIPTKLHVTENYLNNIYSIKWTNIPIPILITCKFDPTLLPNYTPISGIDTTDVLSYPRKNEYGKICPVDIRLKGLPSSAYTVNQNPIYFRATDDDGNADSGYIFTTITSLSPISSTVVMVSTIATNHIPVGTGSTFSFPYGYPVSPEVYVSHPSENVINKISIVPKPLSSICVGVSDYIQDNSIAIGTIDSFNVPTLSAFSSINYQLTGSGIYAIALDPTTRTVYTGDADQDLIICYDTSGAILHTLQLSSITNDSYNTPSSISIDKNHDIWVSLLNNQKILKFDSSLNLLASAIPTDSFPLTAQMQGSYLNSPAVVEVDGNNDIWVSFSHSLSSRLYKFDENGNQLFKVSNFPLSSVPSSLAIDANNNVWVACTESNEIRCYNDTGALLINYNGILKPSYICIDRQCNVWFTHGHDFCSKLNPSTSLIDTWKYNKFTGAFIAVTGGYTAADIILANTNNEIWGGLSIDVYNRVWLIDYTSNKAIMFYASDIANTQISNIIPNATTNYIIHPVTGNIFPVTVPVVHSAQAIGDWTGNKWYQKFAGNLNSLPVEGISTEFKIMDINTPMFLSKKNEEFDCASHFKSLALPEILQQNDVLFDKFFPGVVGDGNPTTESIGRISYEKIANFVDSHGDFQTANIKQLISFAQELSVPAQTYGKDHPASIQRLLDLFSIPKPLLRGIPNIENNISVNLGLRLSFSHTISAGEYIFSRDRITNLYQLIHVVALSSGNTHFPLSSIELEGFNKPITNYYDFFAYLPSNSVGYVGNIVNWDSPYTTLSYDVSSTNEWYGKDGLVELVFNQALTKFLMNTD